MSTDADDDGRLEVAPGCRIDRHELQWRFAPSGGPGGQHANRSNTKAEVRFDIEGSPSLTDDQRARLLERFGPSIRVSCDQERSQARNRALALDRLAARLAAALAREAPRKKTRVPRAVVQRRLDDKRRRAEVKRARRPPGGDLG